MRRTFAVFVLLFLGLVMPATDVMAQSSAGRGAVGGAIIGGAVGGRRGAAIGAATGAVVGAHRDRRARYYWRHGRCWVRAGGRSHPVSHRYCRWPTLTRQARALSHSAATVRLRFRSAQATPDTLRPSVLRGCATH